jgi:cytochrome c556
MVLGCAGSQNANQPRQQAELTKAVSPPQRLTPPETLSPMALAVLQKRMVGHARDMGELFSAIMVLHYPEIHERAESIAADASWSRPLTADATELNSLLPEKFFVHQDELRAGAAKLAAAAARMSALEVADAYGTVSEACVSCHAVYRAGK